MTDPKNTREIPALHDAIVDVFQAGLVNASTMGEMADAILAMPEMQAIRDVLNVLDSVTMIVAPRPRQTVLDMLNLPESVKQWGSLP
jgi:hypothetical protein